jgi:hypothetical protein
MLGDMIKHPMERDLRSKLLNQLCIAGRGSRESQPYKKLHLATEIPCMALHIDVVAVVHTLVDTTCAKLAMFFKEH